VSAAIDANILLYASDETSPFNERALEALRAYAEGSDLLYVFWPVAIAFLRIATHPAIFERPLSPSTAVANLEALITRPNVRTPGERDGFWATYRAVSDQTVVRGNLVPDAHLVALMRQYGVATVVTHDRDFHKFDRIRVRDPVAA
jgi:toxin-antitoxin system PIN domain toxin